MLPLDVLELGLSGGCGLQTAQVAVGGTISYVEQVDVGGSIDSVDVTSQTGPGMLNAQHGEGVDNLCLAPVWKASKVTTRLL